MPVPSACTGLDARGTGMNFGLAKPTAPRTPLESDGTNGALAPLRSVRPPGVLAIHKEDIMAQATALSPQALTTAAKALIETYNDRNWDKARAAITPDFLYDEIATGRRLTGADETLDAWKGWAEAFPDSRGTFQGTHVAEDGAVVLEITWTGTHQGPLQTPGAPIPPTGRRIEIRACAVVEFSGEKARTQRHYFDMATLLRQIGVLG